MYIALGIFTIGLTIVGFHRRNNRRFHKENAIRADLGLPELTRSQYDMTVVEKSEEFRSNVNFHM